MDAIVIARFRALWAYRAWYRRNQGWIPQQQVDDRRELRYLLGLLREWQRREDARPDPITLAKSAADTRGWAPGEGELVEAFGR